MVNHSDLIVVNAARVIFGGPTVGKSLFAQRLALRGAPVADSDVVGKSIEPNWFLRKLWRGATSAETRIYAARVGYRHGVWLTQVPTGIALSNLWSQPYLRGLVYGVASTRHWSEDELRDFLEASLGLAFHHENVSGVTERGPLGYTYCREALQLIMHRANDFSPSERIDDACSEPSVPYRLSGSTLFFRSMPETIRRLSLARGDDGVPLSLARKWVNLAHMTAHESVRNLVWLMSSDQPDTGVMDFPPVKHPQVIDEVRSSPSSEFRLREVERDLPTWELYHIHGKDVFLGDAVALQYPWLPVSFGDDLERGFVDFLSQSDVGDDVKSS